MTFIRLLKQRTSLFALLLILLTSIPILYTNCGSFKSNSKDFNTAYLSSLSCEGRLYVTYKAGFHPFLQSAGCKNCHSLAAIESLAPNDFADPNPTVGFDSFFKDGYGTNPALFSTLINNATTNHQGAGSPKYTEKIQSLSAQWDSEMVIYDECQSKSTGQIIRRTTSQMLRGPNQAIVTLAFDLSKDIEYGTPIQGVLFTIEAEYFKDAVGNEAYRLKNPKIKTQGRAVLVEGISVFIDKSRYATGTTYRSVSMTIPPNATADLVLPDTTPMVVQPAQGIKSENQISFEFRTLKLIP